MFGKIILAALFLSTLSVQAKENFSVDGKFKAYNIGTYKQSGDTITLDSNALSVGGQLGITTVDYSGWYSKVNFMTTNGIAVNDDPNHIDGSVLANDVKVVSGVASDKGNSISVLGEVYLGFDNKIVDLKVGRQKYDSPLAAQKEVRMLPSTFSGLNAHYKIGGHVLGIAYFDKFKQRTSDGFYNILEHALGLNTFAYTGEIKGSLMVASLEVNEKLRLYNYQINNFINSTYLDYKSECKGFKWAVQAIYQTSIGNFDTALKQGLVNATTYQEGLNSSEIGAKVSFGSKINDFTLATTYTGSKSGAYSNLVAPFDGTPLFSDTITGNNLFKSQYGQALNADSGYTADTLSFKAAYKHVHSKTVKSYLALARFDQGSSDVAQTDINAVLSWKTHGWDLAAKAIYVLDNAHNDGDKLQQYRLIATYKFHK